MYTIIRHLLLVLFFLPAFAGAGELKPYDGADKADFTLPSIDGGEIALSTYRGRVVLLNFWATWCPPCIREMPSMQRLQEKLGDTELAVVAVNMGEDEMAVKAFLKQHPVNFDILLDADGEVMNSWKVSVFPTSYLLTPEGKITHVLHGGTEWDSPEIAAIVAGLR